MTRSDFILGMVLTPFAMLFTISAVLLVAGAYTMLKLGILIWTSDVQAARRRQYHVLLALAFAKTTVHVDECKRVGWFWRGALEQLIVDGFLLPGLGENCRMFLLSGRGYRYYSDRAVRKLMIDRRLAMRLT